MSAFLEVARPLPQSFMLDYQLEKSRGMPIKGR